MPQVTGAELVGFLVRLGWRITRKSGSHFVLNHPDHRDPIAIPLHKGKDLPRGTASDLLKQAGFSVDDFLRLR